MENELPVQHSDSSPHARGRYISGNHIIRYRRFIPSYEGADLIFSYLQHSQNDSSPLARGRPAATIYNAHRARFIPSCEGQTFTVMLYAFLYSIHPLLRGADQAADALHFFTGDSSPLARGRHSMFMRLSDALNTSLCNLHKCHFQLVTHHFLYL